ncbi:MAG: hypothetical protein ACM3TN_12275 [Alphaproteobacteria bacterium]
MLQDDQLVSFDGVEEYLHQEHTRNLFGQPDVVLVNEYLHVYQSNLAQTPEMRLAVAVLKDGIDSYVKHLSAKPRRKKKFSNEAEEWFFSKDEDRLFSFENVCGILKIDPGYIRRCLLRYKEAHARLKEANAEPCHEACGGPALRLAS